MATHELFIQTINQLAADIQEYLKRSPKGNTKRKVLGTLAGFISPLSTSNFFTECRTVVRAVNMLAPIVKDGLHRTRLNKCRVKLQIITERRCFLTNETLEISYPDSTTTILNLDDIVEWNDTGVEGIATFDLEFPESSQLRDEARVSLYNYSFVINYEPDRSIDLSSRQGAERAVSRYTWFSNNVYITDIVTKIEQLLPDLPIQRSSQQNKPYVSVSVLETAIAESTAFNPQDRGLNLETLSVQALQTELQNNRQVLVCLNFLVVGLGTSSQTLAELVDNYEGEGAEAIFNEAYQAQVEQIKLVVAGFEQSKTNVLNFIDTVETALIQASIPSDLAQTANALQAQKVNAIAIFDDLDEEVESYESLTLDFDTWNSQIRDVQEDYNTLQNDWTQAWNAFDALVQAYETANPEAVDQRYYARWKREDYRELSTFPTVINRRIDYIELFINPKLQVIQSTGGDGTLEYQDNEDVISASERTRYEDRSNSEHLDHEMITAPLTVGGKHEDDIQQGEVGDCYVLAALTSIVNGTSAHLLNNTIVETETRYTVTLYQEGIPVQVELDKSIMIKNAGPGTTNQRVGAAFGTEAWVAVIEKAYAKLLGGGDYTQIEGGSASEALKVLLGNRVSRPSRIYLDENDAISSEETDISIANPIQLGNPMTVNRLQAILQSAAVNDYELNVSSPDTLNGVAGLTDEHVINIDGTNYMHFKHAYAITAVGGDVTISNPHGTTERSRKIYNPDIARLMQQLMQKKDELNNSFASNQNFSNQLKEDMDAIIQGLLAHDNVSSRNLLERWSTLLENHFNQQGGNWEATRLQRTTRRFNNWITHITELSGRDLGRGFINEEDRQEIHRAQTITYETLNDYFESISINIIS